MGAMVNCMLPPPWRKIGRRIRRECQEFAEASFGVGDDAFEFGRAVAHFHDGHAAAAPVEEFFADALEHGEWQRAGAGVEVECSFGGLR